MNYTTITIDGQKVGLKFGMMAMRMLGETMEKKQLMSSDTLNELGIAYVLWFGYLCNCEAKSVDAQLSFEHFMDYVEAQALGDSSEVTAALGVWSESSSFKKSIEAAEEKKMLIGTL